MANQNYSEITPEEQQRLVTDRRRVLETEHLRLRLDALAPSDPTANTDSLKRRQNEVEAALAELDKIEAEVTSE